MPPLFPCPKSDLHACYSHTAQRLTITAKGKKCSVIVTQGFQQDKYFVGGLKFFFYCYYGGFGEPKEVDYKAALEIPILLPNRVVPSNTVIVATADGDYTIPIEFGDCPRAKSGNDKNLSASQSLGSVLPPINIFVPGDGTPFQITAQFDIVNVSGVDIDFDPKSLKLTNASIVGTRIEWTLEALPGFLGQTLVNVETTFVKEIGDLAYQKIQPYLVDVVVLEKQGAK